MSFGIFDIVLIALVVLVAAIGLKKGIVEQLTGGITFLGSIVLTFFVYKYVANFVLTSDLLYTISQKFYGLVAANATEEQIKATVEVAQAEGVKDVLSAMKIPGFIHNMFLKSLDDTIASNPSMLVGDYVANAFATKTIIIGSFIVTFIVALIIIGILVKLLRKLADLPGIKVLDRILGMLFKVLKFAILVFVLFYVVTLLYNIPTLGDTIKDFMSTQLKLDDDTQMGVAKWVYLNNPVTKVLSQLSFKEMLSGVTGGNGGGGEELANIVKIALM